LRDDVRENGGALDDVRALPTKGKNFSCRGCTRRPMGHPPGPTTCTAVRGAPPLHEKGVGPQRTTKRQGKEISLLATLNV
jgi:hypothetical protein